MDFLFPFHHHGQGYHLLAASSDQLDQPSSRKQSIVDFHMGSFATCAPPLVGCRKNGAPKKDEKTATLAEEKWSQ